jgi:hypothetical protein
MKILSHFYAVTVEGAAWEIKAHYYTYKEKVCRELTVQKIYQRNHPKGAPLQALQNGSTLGITNLGLIRFFQPSSHWLKLGERAALLPPERVDKGEWGGQTKPIVALFLEESESTLKLCIDSGDTTPWSERWENYTINVCARIGFFHPILVLSEAEVSEYSLPLHFYHTIPTEKPLFEIEEKLPTAEETQSVSVIIPSLPRKTKRVPMHIGPKKSALIPEEKKVFPKMLPPIMIDEPAKRYTLKCKEDLPTWEYKNRKEKITFETGVVYDMVAIDYMGGSWIVLESELANGKIFGRSVSGWQQMNLYKKEKGADDAITLKEIVA